ncbi:MAG: hypothetical protein J6U95_01240 [Alistipes sp.]|nr:hypothetical protein [Alistipes sp.]
MKKNLFVVVFAVAGMLLTCACSNEELGAVESKSDAKVTFKLGLENAMNTRAISDGSLINKLHFAIFDSTGAIVESSKDRGAEFPFNTSVSLVKGEQYTAVFWAQNKDCTAYTISEDMTTIEVDYAGALNNDEARDAFFRSETFVVDGDVVLDVVLKRALAQLNVGVSAEEWNKFLAEGDQIVTSEVEIKQAATALNLVDGSVSGASDVKFEVGAIPTESLKVDIDSDGVAEECKYLSMCYFLANDTNDGASKTTLNDLKFTFNSNYDSFVLEEGLDNAPVQRNHRTNIVLANGYFVGDISVNVKLDVLYDGEHTLNPSGVWEERTGIYTEEALAGLTIEMPAGWHIRNGYIIEPMPEYWTADMEPLYHKSYTVDGMGNTVRFEPYAHKYVTKNAFAATDSQLVTVKNITFEGEHFGVYGGVYGGVKGRNAYNTVFENVTIVDNAIYCYNIQGTTPISAFSNLGTAKLIDCTITDTRWVGSKDENVNAQKAIDNYGGVFDVFVPNDGKLEIISSTVGRICVHNHAHITIASASNIEKIVAPQLVNGLITVKEGANVEELDVDQYSASYPPKVTIEQGATIGTLQLHSIKKTKINIDANAIIGKIIWNDVEYTSIADFLAA